MLISFNKRRDSLYFFLLIAKQKKKRLQGTFALSISFQFANSTMLRILPLKQSAFCLVRSISYRQLHHRSFTHSAPCLKKPFDFNKRSTGITAKHVMELLTTKKDLYWVQRSTITEKCENIQ